MSKEKKHDKAVTALCTLDQCVVSGSLDSTVKVWEVISSETSGPYLTLSDRGKPDLLAFSDELKASQVMLTGKRYPLTLALAFLPGTKGEETRKSFAHALIACILVLLLAESGTGTEVQLYLRNEGQVCTIRRSCIALFEDDE